METFLYKQGEGCIGTVAAILWDIYDSNNDENDSISLGHSAYWDIFLSEDYVIRTFSDFIDCFYSEYPNYIDDIAVQLTYYEIASSIPTINNEADMCRNVPATFSWVAQGGSSNFPNNSFALIFYNNNGVEIMRTAERAATASSHNCNSTVSYTLTQSEWEYVMSHTGVTFTVAIAAKQTSSVITGEYISAQSKVYMNPERCNDDGFVEMALFESYKEFYINLEQGQEVEYVFTVEFSNCYLIQSFGTKQVEIELYDPDGNLMMRDDGSGYNGNAFIAENFEYEYNADHEAYYEYTIKIRFNNFSDTGFIKIGITAVDSLYESYYNIESRIGFSGSYDLQKEWEAAELITFIPTASGTYTIHCSCRDESCGDVLLYFVDPTKSTEACLVTSNPNGSNAAEFVVELEYGVRYYIVVTTENFSNQCLDKNVAIYLHEENV